MRIASFQWAGERSYGVVSESGIFDLRRQGLGDFPDLKSALEAGALSRIDASLLGERPDMQLRDVVLLPPIPNPDKILCVGSNYREHREELSRAPASHPTLFTRFANTQVGHGSPLLLPQASRQLDFEGELAVVIGRRGRHVPERDALAYVAGYACYMDATLRDWQRHSTQFTAGKNFVATGGFGPWLVTPEEVGDPRQLELKVRLNGDPVQQVTTDRMLFEIPTLIAYISTFTELAPGDVIATGTPSGVGAARTPPLFMKAGDRIEVEISRVGLLQHEIEAET